MKDVAVSSDGIQIAFEAHGTGAPSVVFVHGWSCDRSYWRGQIEHFAGRNHVVAIDLAGHGESGVGRPTWTMPAFGEDVVAVAEKLHLQEMVLVGHSMGGDAIVEAGLRLADRVIGLVWVDVYSSLDDPRPPEEIEEFADSFRGDFASTTRAFVRDRMFVPGSDPDLADWIADDMASAPPEIAIDALRHAISNDRPMPGLLKRLTAPLVAIDPDHGRGDIDALAPHGVKTVQIPGVGHFLMMEDPETFNRVLGEVVQGFQPRAG